MSDNRTIAEKAAAEWLLHYVSREAPPKPLPDVIEQAIVAAQAELVEALQKVTDHLAGVMGGPVMQAYGVVFENGVEGIPTIAKARAVLAKVKGGDDAR